MSLPAGHGRISVGRISGVFGVRGWMRVYSYTAPRDNVIRYSPWILSADGREQVLNVVAGQLHGEGVVVALEGVQDREAAAALIGAEILVDRSALGEAGESSFYWADLEGMKVRTVSGEVLGVVAQLFETGANDVMIVVGAHRHLIPFVYGGVVKSVDEVRQEITVDWDPDF